MVKTETNTRARAARIRRAWAARKLKRGPYSVFCEHGQWWVHHLASGAAWSVVDAEGGPAVDGVDFEQVAEGEEDERMAQESVLLVSPDDVDGSYLEDGAMPYARWTHTYVRGQIEPTLRLALRAGKHGAGHTLGAVHCWPHSAKSLEAADRICARMEADARAAGYTILPDADTEAG